MKDIELYHGDCLDVMRTLEECSIDSIVTDPPYGLSFMGKDWDHGVPGEVFWIEALRIAKPGAHLLAFGGSRTFHRLAVAIEDAGWEIRDTIMWVYGSGFPKSLNIGKAIDKTQGNKRETLGIKKYASPAGNNRNFGVGNNDENNKKRIDTKGFSEWEGWGTALKPAHEPIIVARKPFKGTVVANVLKHGTGGINIDKCRIDGIVKTNPLVRNVGGFKSNGLANQSNPPTSTISQSRFPANFIHDGSDEVLALFPESNGRVFPAKSNIPTEKYYESGWGNIDNGKRSQMSNSSAARFFYCAKASKFDRDEGLDGMELKKPHPSGNKFATTSIWNGENGDEEWQKKNPNTPRANHHPTVKPIALMRYLCKLVTPPNGIVLDPFMGSGSTGKAAKIEGFKFIGIELEQEYIEIAQRRIDAINIKTENS